MALMDLEEAQIFSEIKQIKFSNQNSYLLIFVVLLKSTNTIGNYDFRYFLHGESNGRFGKFIQFSF